MKLTRMLGLAILLLISGLAVAYYYITGNKHMNVGNLNAVEVELKTSGKSMMKKYPSLVTVSQQPAGLAFYEIDWTSKNKGVVKLNHGKYSTEIENVLSVLGTEDSEKPDEGVSEIFLVCGITGPNGIDDAGARDYFFSVIGELKASGWRSTIPFSAPRLTSKDMLSFMFELGEDTTLGSDYKPTLEEWKKLENLSTWEFYADGVFLSLSFTRDNTLSDRNSRAAYLINLEIRSAEEYFRSFVAPNQRENWRALLPSAIENSKVRRRQLEEMGVKKGLQIDRSYTDPPLPSL